MRSLIHEYRHEERGHLTVGQLFLDHNDGRFYGQVDGGKEAEGLGYFYLPARDALLLRVKLRASEKTEGR